MVSVKIPPSTRPRAYPKGWPMPFIAKATLRQCPRGKVLVMRLTAVGRHMEMATPRNVRNRITWIAVLAKPKATVKMTKRKLPVTQTRFVPMMSAAAPNTKGRHPAARA